MQEPTCWCWHEDWGFGNCQEDWSSSTRFPVLEKSLTNDINLSMPDSIDFYRFKLNQAKEIHTNLKENPEKRSHGYSLTYAKKDVNNFKKKLDMAILLWGNEEDKTK